MIFTIKNKLVRPCILTYLKQPYPKVQSHCTAHNTVHPPPPPPRPNTGTRRNLLHSYAPHLSMGLCTGNQVYGTPSSHGSVQIMYYKHFYTGAYPVPTISIYHIER
ncbi:hypothetical protein LguiA_001483 [Lonicera macranthoides]